MTNAPPKLVDLCRTQPGAGAKHYSLAEYLDRVRKPKVKFIDFTTQDTRSNVHEDDHDARRARQDFERWGWIKVHRKKPIPTSKVVAIEFMVGDFPPPSPGPLFEYFD